MSTDKDIEAAIDLAIAEHTKPKLVEVKSPANDALNARESLKAHIKLAFANAMRDRDYAANAIAEIEQAVKMHVITRRGLQGMLDDADERIKNARVQMASLQGE